MKAQHWTAVGLDFVIVMLGAFLANQISDWTASRSARTQEISYLRSMASGTSELIAVVVALDGLEQ